MPYELQERSPGGVATMANGTDNRTVVHRALTALNRLSLDEMLEVTDPDVDLETPLIGIWGTEPRGHDRVREWFQRIGREWAFLEVYDVELEELGDWVLGRMRGRGRGKASPNELDWDLHLAARVVDGKLVKLGTYLTREGALDAIEADRD